MQLDGHVRMDLLYGAWSPRTRTWVDSFTIVFLLAYLVLLLYGGLSSTQYALEYGERSYSSWRPYMAPIKIVACIGIFLMAAPGVRGAVQGHRQAQRRGALMSYEMIALLMFASMMLMLITGQRVFAAIGAVAALAAFVLWGDGGSEMAFSAAMKLMKVVSAAHPADVHLHGVHALRIRPRRRSLPDVPRVVRAGPRRARHRHHRPHGGHLRDERAERGGHGHRGDHRAPRAAAPQLRQDHGHRGHPGRQLARNPGAAERGAGALRHDRAASRSASSGSQGSFRAS